MKRRIDKIGWRAVAVAALVILSAGVMAQETRHEAAISAQGSAAVGAAPSPDRPAAVGQLPIKQTPAPDVSSGPAVEGRRAGELSPWSMFLAADILVKAVMIGLMLASLATWTIFAAKTIEMSVARRGLGKALALIERAKTLSEAKIAAGSRAGLLPRLVAAALEEMEFAAFLTARAGIKERAESRFADLVRAETQAMRRGMGLLATIGATAPFVGLFGTVWGIMNSFIGISKAQTTNLAVVAPGIAEALLATATGLLAAIPAVIIYNHFSRATRSYQLLVGRAASATSRLLSRELDRDRTSKPARLVE